MSRKAAIRTRLGSIDRRIYQILETDLCTVSGPVSHTEVVSICKPYVREAAAGTKGMNMRITKAMTRAGWHKNPKTGMFERTQ